MTTSNGLCDFVADVFVRLKEGVHDPALDAVAQAAEALSLSVQPIYLERAVRLSIRAATPEEATAHAEACARNLLVNPTLETYRVALVRTGATDPS